MAEHTQGKLKTAIAIGVTDHVELRDEVGRRIAVVAGLYPMGPITEDANAARLALCWNCHDELVAALENALAYPVCGNWHEQARAVLKQAKGE